MENPVAGVRSNNSKAIKLGLVLVVLVAAVIEGVVLGLRSSRNKSAAAQTASAGASVETGAPSLSPFKVATDTSASSVSSYPTPTVVETDLHSSAVPTSNSPTYASS